MVALLVTCLILPILLVVGSIALSRYMILSASSGKTFSDVRKLPANKVGVVLGCSPKVAGGRENLFFRYRIQAALEAFEQGKVEYLIVSGDNHIATYDEPSDMKAALVKMGIPEERIYCDYAGFRTLDSMVRAKEVFQESKITVISQQFHNQRAIFLAQKRGLEAVAYNARDVSSHRALKTRIREQLARVKAVIDIVVRRAPKFLGDPIRVGVDAPE